MLVKYVVAHVSLLSSWLPVEIVAALDALQPESMGEYLQLRTADWFEWLQLPVL